MTIWFKNNEADSVAAVAVGYPYGIFMDIPTASGHLWAKSRVFHTAPRLLRGRMLTRNWMVFEYGFAILQSYLVSREAFMCNGLGIGCHGHHSH
jgi:hypothetical protein